jgi:hypothetical protein
MNFHIFSHLFNNGIRLYICYAIVISLITHTLEQNYENGQNIYTQSHNNRRHHNHHNGQNDGIRRHLSNKVQAKSEPINQMARKRDFQTSRRVSDSSTFIWNKKSSSSVLFDQPSSFKPSRRRNSTSKLPNIIFILTDDQDIELGMFSTVLFPIISFNISLYLV